jgi:hypothetical protein
VHDFCVFDCGEYYKALKSRRVVGDDFRFKSFPPLYTTLYLRYYSVQCFFVFFHTAIPALLLLSNENTIMSKKAKCTH